MSNLKRRTFTALVWDVGGTFLKQGSTFITSIFLARLLEPEQFGLIAMVLVFVPIVEVFIDTGFSSALIQNENNTRLTYSSIFYFNILAGLCLTVVVYFSAPLIGNFYDNQQITELMRWLSLIFLFNSGNLVQIAILRKKLNFKPLTVRTSISAGLGGILGIVAAFNDFGVYSLVIQHVSTAIIGTFLLWSVSNWRPDLKFSFQEVKNLYGFSVFIFFDRILSELSKRMDIVIIGKLFSASTLGYYTRALTLKDLVGKYSTTSVIRVLYPVLSNVRHDIHRFQAIYYKLLSSLAFVSFGLTGLLFILGQDIIIILFGVKWMPSVEIFQMLIFAGLNYPINALMINAYLSQGKSRESFKIGAIRKALRFTPLLFAYYFGLFEFIIALVSINYINTIINILYMSQHLKMNIGVHFRKLFEAMIPMILVVLAFYSFEFDSGSVFGRMLLSGIYIILYIGFNFIIKNEGFFYVLQSIKPLLNRIRKR